MSKNSKKQQTVGFLDKGKNTTLINCSSENHDIGLKAEGVNLYAESFSSKNNIEKLNKWYELWWVKYLIFPIIVLIIGALLVFYLGLN